MARQHRQRKPQSRGGAAKPKLTDDAHDPGKIQLGCMSPVHRTVPHMQTFVRGNEPYTCECGRALGRGK
jgi:hypothetical protein